MGTFTRSAYGDYRATNRAASGLRVLLNLRPDGQRMEFLVGFLRHIPLVTRANPETGKSPGAGLFYRDAGEEEMEVKLRAALRKTGAVPVRDPESGEVLWTLHPGGREVVEVRAVKRLPTRKDKGLEDRPEREAPAPKVTATRAAPAPQAAPRVSRVRWTRENCLEALGAWMDEHGRQPAMTDWNGTAPGRPGRSTIAKRFGGWTEFMQAAGLSLLRSGGPRNVSILWTRERIIEAMLRWTAEHGQPPKRHDWERAGEYWPHRSAVQTRFGGFAAAREAAGLPIGRGADGFTWSRDSIADAIRQWAAEHGEPPTVTQWRFAVNGYPTPTAIRGHFASWNEAITYAGFEPRGQGRRRRAA